MLPSIGEQLRQARTQKRLTLEQAVQDTRIRIYYLEALENDDFESLPSPLQARGFLRSYAEYLGLNASELISQMNGDSRPEAPAPVEEPAPVVVEVKALEPEPTPQVEVNQIIEDELEIEEIETPQEEFAPSHISQTIFTEIGNTLRARRELLSLTLEEIERHTHVRKSHLEQIESGAFEKLSSPVQARGMLNNYARFLDLDVDSLLLRFADALQARRIELAPQNENQKKSPTLTIASQFSLRQFVSADMLIGGGFILMIILFSIWGASQILSLQTNTDAQPTAPSISEVLLASEPTQSVVIEATPSPVFDSAQDPLAPQQTETPFPTIESTLSSAPVQVVLSILENVWVRVVVDGEVAFEGRAASGSAFPFEGDEQIEVVTGNASAIRVIYNGDDLGLLGAPNQLIDTIYTARGIISPTITITPSPTNTLPPSATPFSTPSP